MVMKKMMMVEEEEGEEERQASWFLVIRPGHCLVGAETDTGGP